MGSTGFSGDRPAGQRASSDQCTGSMPVPCLRERLAACDFTGADRCQGTSSQCGSERRKALGSHWPWKTALRPSQYERAAGRDCRSAPCTDSRSPTFANYPEVEIFPTVELIDRLYPPPDLALRYPDSYRADARRAGTGRPRRVCDARDLRRRSAAGAAGCPTTRQRSTAGWKRRRAKIRS